MQAIKICSIGVKCFTLLGFNFKLWGKVVVHGYDNAFETIKYRKDNNQCRAAHKNPQHGYTRNNIDGMRAFARKQVPLGYIKGGIQLF